MQISTDPAWPAWRWAALPDARARDVISTGEVLSASLQVCTSSKSSSWTRLGNGAYLHTCVLCVLQIRRARPMERTETGAPFVPAQLSLQMLVRQLSLPSHCINCKHSTCSVDAYWCSHCALTLRRLDRLEAVPDTAPNTSRDGITEVRVTSAGLESNQPRVYAPALGGLVCFASSRATHHSPIPPSL